MFKEDISISKFQIFKGDPILTPSDSYTYIYTSDGLLSVDHNSHNLPQQTKDGNDGKLIL